MWRERETREHFILSFFVSNFLHNIKVVDGVHYLVVVVVVANNAHIMSGTVVYATGHPVVVGDDNTSRLLLVEEQYFGPISCLACLGTSLLIGPFALFVCLCPCDRRQLSAVDAQMPRQMVVVDRPPRPQTMMMQPREPEAVARPEGTNEHYYPKV